MSIHTGTVLRLLFHLVILQDKLLDLLLVTPTILRRLLGSVQLILSLKIVPSSLLWVNHLL